jgi:hypothetical protein
MAVTVKALGPTFSKVYTKSRTTSQIPPDDATRSLQGCPVPFTVHSMSTSTKHRALEGPAVGAPVKAGVGRRTGAPVGAATGWAVGTSAPPISSVGWEVDVGALVERALVGRKVGKPVGISALTSVGPGVGVTGMDSAVGKMVATG